MKKINVKLKLGWLPDLPDYRDFSLNKVVNKGSSKSKKESEFMELMSAVIASMKDSNEGKNLSLKKWFSPVEDQKNIGSCTANAGVGLLEYFQNRVHGKFINASRLFLYKTTRNLMGVYGDTGAYLRSTMKALSIFGVPPEDYWSYNTESFDEEPSAFCYSFAQNFQALKYYRIDYPGLSREDLLNTIKKLIDIGLPSMFGFTVFSSIGHKNVIESGEIPYPVYGENQEGGHAIVALGYDNKKKVIHPLNDDIYTTGAFYIRNSWGENWGDVGYGWLPYDYVLHYMAIDWWSLIDSEWKNLSVFD